MWPTKKKRRRQQMKVFSGTSVGMVREKNEDYYYASQNDIKLFIVADGMGRI